MYVFDEILTQFTTKNRIRSGKHSCACHLLIAGILLGVLSDPEDGGDIFFRNIGEFLRKLPGVTIQKAVLVKKLFLSTSIIILNPRIYYN
jgi:hypothetical protein